MTRWCEGKSGVSASGPEDQRSQRRNALKKDRRDETKVAIIIAITIVIVITFTKVAIIIVIFIVIVITFVIVDVNVIVSIM